MNELIHIILEADKAVFLWVNNALSNDWFDAVLPWCRERFFWTPVYLFLFILLGVNLGIKKSVIIAVFLGLTVGLADFTSSELIKKNVKRVRPCNDLLLNEYVQLRIAECGGGYSFTSSHAANHFAVAVFLIGIFGRCNRWVGLALLFWAGLIAFSQVYVGVHYPLDVTCGALLGVGVGWTGYYFFRRTGFADNLFC